MNSYEKNKYDEYKSDKDLGASSEVIPFPADLVAGMNNPSDFVIPQNCFFLFLFWLDLPGRDFQGRTYFMPGKKFSYLFCVVIQNQFWTYFWGWFMHFWVYTPTNFPVIWDVETRQKALENNLWIMSYLMENMPPNLEFCVTGQIPVFANEFIGLKKGFNVIAGKNSLLIPSYIRSCGKAFVKSGPYAIGVGVSLEKKRLDYDNSSI